MKRGWNKYGLMMMVSKKFKLYHEEHEEHEGRKNIIFF